MNDNLFNNIYSFNRLRRSRTICSCLSRDLSKLAILIFLSSSSSSTSESYLLIKAWVNDSPLKIGNVSNIFQTFKLCHRDKLGLLDALFGELWAVVGLGREDFLSDLQVTGREA